MLAGFPKQIDAVLGNEMITYVHTYHVKDDTITIHKYPIESHAALIFHRTFYY